ncbi:MAG: ROK family protein [Chitinophagaceae bacterium]
MTALGIDLGGTKLSFAVFSQQGGILYKHTVEVEKRSGKEVGDLIADETQNLIVSHNIQSIGIAVPGIYHQTGTVWAPNIKGWDDYPLLQHMQAATNIPVTIDSDRACYILGESWKGNAKDCNNAIYLAVGTGIGAGILIDGKILRGQHDIAGAIGWLALQQPFEEKYISCGCFEHHASGEGIAKVAREILKKENYNGMLKQKPSEELTAHDIFAAYEKNDKVAKEVFSICIRFWGMAVANLVSLFNPGRIILGGGVFGPAIQFISAIKDEATKWAQPISMKQVSIEASALGNDAGLYGAGYLALKRVSKV